jgi:hypothetical protein
MGRNGASKAVVALASVVALLASGCVMGRRSWSYEESARIDEVTGSGFEPLEEALAQGVVVPAVPANAAPLAYASAEGSAKPSKKIKLGKTDSKGRLVRKGSGSSKSKGFRFSGLN